MVKTQKLGKCILILFIMLTLMSFVFADVSDADTIVGWSGDVRPVSCDVDGNYCAQLDGLMQQEVYAIFKPNTTYYVSFDAKSMGAESVNVYLFDGQIKSVSLNSGFNTSEFNTYVVSFKSPLDYNGYATLQFKSNGIVVLDKLKLEESYKPLATEYSYSNSLSPMSCCPADYCWNGNTCVKGETIFGKDTWDSNKGAFSFGAWGFNDYGIDGYVCDSGEWNPAYYKEKWFADSVGYCTSDFDCWDGEKCVINGNYSGDYWCENGNWTSRTKYIALQLLDIVRGSNNFSLFCDNYKNSLNSINYLTNGIPVEDYLTGGLQSAIGGLSGSTETNLVNNFCVLSQFNNQEVVALGVALNQPIDVSELNVLRALGDYDCRQAFNEDSEKEDGQFHSCGYDGRLWYNYKTNALIYSKTGVILNEISFFDNFFVHPIRTLIDLVVNFFRPSYRPIAGGIVGEETEISYEFALNQPKLFNRIYVNVLNDKDIFGSIEQVSAQDSVMVISYTNVPNVCKAANKYNNQFVGTQATGLNCNETVDGSVVVSRDDDAMARWIDATAKIRLS